MAAQTAPIAFIGNLHLHNVVSTGKVPAVYRNSLSVAP